MSKPPVVYPQDSPFRINLVVSSVYSGRTPLLLSELGTLSHHGQVACLSSPKTVKHVEGGAMCVSLIASF